MGSGLFILMRLQMTTEENKIYLINSSKNMKQFYRWDRKQIRMSWHMQKCAGRPVTLLLRTPNTFDSVDMQKQDLSASCQFLPIWQQIENLSALYKYRRLSMGCTPSTEGLHNHIPPQYLNQFQQMSNIDDPLNVNKRYQHLMVIDKSNVTGSSYRKTYAYNALATKEEIEQKRKEFWETRNNGLPENWQAIKKAVYARHNSTGVGHLQKNKLLLLNGSIQFCIDSHLNRYEVPIFCINEPTSFSQERLDDKNLSTDYEDNTIQIIVRPGSEPNGDFKINDYSSSSIQIVKETIKVLRRLKDDGNVRLFYKGREMKDQKTFGNYAFQTGSIVQAIIT